MNCSNNRIREAGADPANHPKVPIREAGKCGTGIIRTAALILAAASALGFAGACTEVDDRLGESLLPDNQQMKVEVVSLTDVAKVWQYSQQDVLSARLGHGYLGRMTDPDGVFGARTNSLLVQFMPSSRPYEGGEGYGIDPIVDSALIVMVLDDVRGNTDLPQTFDVYDVVEGSDGRLHRDSVYRSDFDVEDRLGQKLFEFTHKGRGRVTSRLFPTDAGRKYLDSIVNLGWDDYKTDSMFYKKFQGFYITPAEGSHEDASVLEARLASSGLELYVRNHDSIDVSAIYDTIRSLFSFRDTDELDPETGMVTEWNNVSVNMARFDYSGSALGDLETSTAGFTDTLASSPARPVAYVQGMGGVGAMLRLTPEAVASIGELGDGGDMGINQAMMYIRIADDSTPALDASVARLGSYLNFRSLIPIPDYQYRNEGSTNADGSLYELPYNGRLNRSNGYYELDITSYIQQLAKKLKATPDGEDYTPEAIYLAPEAFDLFDFGGSTLLGPGSEEPIELRITYTLIKG